MLSTSALIGWLGLIGLLSNVPNLSLPGYGAGGNACREIAHTMVYAMLCLLAWSCMPAPARTSRTKVVLCLMLCLAVAVLDEWNQTKVPGRHGELKGVFFDLMGASWTLALINLKNELIAAISRRYILYRANQR